MADNERPTKFDANENVSVLMNSYAGGVAIRALTAYHEELTARI